MCHKCFRQRPFLKLTLFFSIGIIFSVSHGNATAKDFDLTDGPPKFLGARSCSSTSCHGGAGNNKQQYTIWLKSDFHHTRPYATLETPRAERLAQVLKIGNPLQSTACTTCHAPLQTVPTEDLAQDVQIIEGVSCECCHGPARNWLRGHTRHDWTHADRVRAGMRDLKSLYVRANVCVACHQTLAADIRAAGHPELIFELDGQAVSQPKHWRASEDKPGPQIWLVGQAVALREMSWQLERENVDPDLPDRWAALAWLLQLTGQANDHWPKFAKDGVVPNPNQFNEARQWSDQLARQVSDSGWSEELTRLCLARLSNTSDSFGDESISAPVRARRAERLVLAVDRLITGLNQAQEFSALNPLVDQLFDDVQSLPDFEPKLFAKHLQQFHARASELFKSG